MRIAIASTFVPFRKADESTVAHHLAKALGERGYLVETVLLPFDLDWQAALEQTLAIRAVDLSECSGNKIDLLITLRTPAYALPHRNKVVWFGQHHHDAADPWATPYGPTGQEPELERIRHLLSCSDSRYLNESRKIYASSKTVADRLKKLNGINVHGILYPPLFRPEKFHSADYGDYFLYVSRLNPRKRQDLAIQAMKSVKSPFKLILAGQSEPQTYSTELQRLIRLLDLEDRVQLLGWVSEKEKVDLLANACAALCLPREADSYGYATLEAFQANKPVITLADSGGPTEVIEDSCNGLIVEPQAPALAAAMENLWGDKTRTALMGRNAHDSIRFHNICWEPVLEALVA